MTEYHADDYGLFTEQSKRILRCWKDGSLNGTSIIPNGKQLNECLDLLPKSGIALTVHLNFMQGQCLAPIETVPLLVNDNGVFDVSFAKLFLSSYSRERDNYKQQLKSEIHAQIHTLLPYFDKHMIPLRIDGHAHWHMIPVVFDALMEIIAEEDLAVTYIRFPYEPLQLYLRNLFKLFPFPPINIVKSILLRFLARRNRKCWSQALSGMETKVFLGVFLSNCFDLRRMTAILPDAEMYAESKAQELEILAHPGAVKEAQDLTEITNNSDYRFFTSPSRDTEAEGFIRIGK